MMRAAATFARRAIVRGIVSGTVSATVLGACRSAPPCAGGAGATGGARGAACPRDATTDASGRCACLAGTVALLGACVPPAVADGYCMTHPTAARWEGCRAPACSDSEAVDLDEGCTALASLTHGGPSHCEPGKAALVVDEHRAACVPPDDACPRGTRSSKAKECASPPSCPPGTLNDDASCRPIVTPGRRGPVVDLGSWASRVLGRDGGDGSEELCRPIAARPVTFGLAPGQKVLLDLRVAVVVPAQDISRVSARVTVRRVAATPSSTLSPTPPPAASTTPTPAPAPARALLPTPAPTAPGTALSPAAMTVLDRAVQSLVEPLRSLGGEASAGAAEVDVRCSVSSL
ncbi:MAG TPA: hypothetical protein VIY73_24420 [Polyangiaceae bacterium]